MSRNNTFTRSTGESVSYFRTLGPVSFLQWQAAGRDSRRTPSNRYRCSCPQWRHLVISKMTAEWSELVSVTGCNSSSGQGQGGGGRAAAARGGARRTAGGPGKSGPMVNPYVLEVADVLKARGWLLGLIIFLILCNRGASLKSTKYIEKGLVWVKNNIYLVCLFRHI